MTQGLAIPVLNMEPSASQQVDDVAGEAANDCPPV